MADPVAPPRPARATEAMARGPVAARADPFEALNPRQREAVLHCGGPLLVLAGAGTGKTMTLAARVARRVLDGADPQRLLLLTFSRRAAHEMAQRAGRLLHQALGLPATRQPPALPWAGTFHGIGARLLRELAPQIGLPEQFSIIDRGDSEDLIGLVRERLGLAASQRRFPLKATCLAIYSRCVNRQAPLAQVLADDFPWCADSRDALKALFGAYVAEKAAQATLDYDDLLLAWQQLMAVPALAAQLGARFDDVMVDEYQDTNLLQSAILHALKPDGRGLTVVGDDAQSIYSFRAAEVGNILGFAGRFDPPARQVALEQNYRSTQPILDAANAVIALSPQRHAKTLWSDRASSQKPLLVTVADELDQARQVADGVLAQREQGLPLKQQAVLFRTGHHSAALELELVRRNIPFVKFGGLKFLEAAHLKDLLAVLRWAHNPRSRLAGFRVAQLVPGIGPAGARRLLDAMAAAADPRAALAAFEPPPGARSEWADLVALMGRLDPPQSVWPDELAEVQAWYAPHLQRLHPDDSAVRLADLEQLARIATGYRNRERFLTELTLDPPEASSDLSGAPHLDEDYLILSTLHSAKGQEWSAVTILNVVDGCLPADLATGSAALVEEERRLLYVGMTRARHHLQLMVPLRFHVSQQHQLGDRHLYGGLSRFIPPEVAACFERQGSPAPPTELALGSALPAGTVDILSRLRAAWD